MEVVEAKILTNPTRKSTKLLVKSLNKLSDKSPLPFYQRIQQLKKKVSHIKKDNLLLFLTMRVQCKIARKDEKYLQDYCVRIA
ncbi:hypothetical protein BPADB04_34580 [Bacillus paranthracis]|nr:hypothetical protein BPADB04_34580 [Bacillus paranthracis]